MRTRIDLQTTLQTTLLAASISVAAVASAAIGFQAPAPPLTLNEVLFRANEAVVAYEKLFASVVGEERYAQQILYQKGTVKRTRALVSDLLLLRMPDEDTWIGFRDVFEVDGKPVRDRQARLQKLFLETPQGALGQARKIAVESARYNIGEVYRNINVPTMALVFLHPLHQHRFNFEKIGEERVSDVPVWAISYSEFVRPTLIRAGGGDLFAHGTFWIEPGTGQVVKSQLILGDRNMVVRSQITVTFRHDATLGFRVPATMEELYDNPRNPREDRITGSATYSNFRRFEVRVEENIKLPK